MKKIKTYAGFQKKFQGLGIMFSNDEPYSINPYWSIELKLFWFKCWLTRLKKKND